MIGDGVDAPPIPPSRRCMALLARSVLEKTQDLDSGTRKSFDIESRSPVVEFGPHSCQFTQGKQLGKEPP